MTTMLGQDALMNATQQQMVSTQPGYILCSLCSMHWDAQSACSKCPKHSFCQDTAQQARLLTPCGRQASHGLHVQVHLHDNGSVSGVVFELSCPVLEDHAGMLPVFMAQLPPQNSQPGQAHANMPILNLILTILCRGSCCCHNTA